MYVLAFFELLNSKFKAQKFYFKGSLTINGHGDIPLSQLILKLIIGVHG